MHEISYTPEGNIRGRTADLKKLGIYRPIFFLPQNYPGEQWLPVTDQAVPGIVDGYYISDYGELFSIRKGPTLKVHTETYDGYLRNQVRLKDGRGYSINIHRLVMLTFCYKEGCRELEVNHIDGNKHNNYIGNLEWCTNAENINHAVSHGLQHHHCGEDCSFATITNDQADEIGKLLSENKLSHIEIANMIGTTVSVVHNIAGGYSWKGVYKKYNLSKNKGHNYNGYGATDEQLEQMCQYMEKYAPYYTTLGSLFNAMLNDLYGIQYDRYTMCPTLRQYYHGKIRRYITGKYHPQLGIACNN